ncbi:MAG: histidinol-phosphatase [Pirellulales bacterium]|nr:histidinol-phosphatase [Pirellulales bacterium]
MSNRSNTEVQARLDLAIDIAREAGQITLRYFRRFDLQVESKPDHSPVTAADRLAELQIRHRISQAFPDDAVLGEEIGQKEGSGRYRWIIDPIDGTKSFVAGVPLYTTLIGIMDGDASRAGVLFAPATGEMVYAAIGSGAWFIDGDAEPCPARVSKIDQFSNALFLTTEVKNYTEYRRKDALPVFLELQSRARMARTWGDAYGYLMVATGRADIMIDPALNLWDAAPLLPILEEAGGRFTDWNGHPTVLHGDGIGTNGHLHEQVLEYTRNYSIHARND